MADDVWREDAMRVLPSQHRRALRIIRPHDDGMHPATQRARLEDAKRMIAEYAAAQRIHTKSVDDAFNSKGIESVDMDDPAARDAFRERIAYDLPALRRVKEREFAIAVYGWELERIEKIVQAREHADK